MTLLGLLRLLAQLISLCTDTTMDMGVLATMGTYVPVYGINREFKQNMASIVYHFLFNIFCMSLQRVYV